MTAVFCTRCGTSVDVADEFCRSCGQHQRRVPAQFHPMSRRKLVLLYLGTLGLYAFVWFWLQWGAVAQAKGARLGPVARAAFFPMTSHALFDEVNAALTARAAAPPHPPPRLLKSRTLAVILMGYVWAAPLLLPGLWMFVFLLGFLPLLTVQARINALNDTGAYHYVRNSRFRPWLAAPLLPGGAVLAYVAAMIAGIVPTSQVLSGRTLSDRQDALVRGLADLEDGESIELFFSGGFFSFAEDGNIVTDRRIVSYFQDAETGDFAVDWADYARIRSLHVFYGGIFHLTSIYACTGGDDSLLLFSSGNPRGDYRMIAAIRSRLVPGTLIREEKGEDFVCPNEVTL